MALSSVPRMFKTSVQHAALASAGPARFCDVLAKGSQRTRQAVSLPRCLATLLLSDWQRYYNLRTCSG